MTLDHVVNNWQYYKDKIALPFTEVLGVGKNATEITINTEEEMIAFLKTKDALNVNSAFHEIIAMANIFKIHIHVFTYVGDSGNWNYISPDPEMAATTEIEFKDFLSDMYLYHSDDNHYNLLVSESAKYSPILKSKAATEKCDGVRNEWTEIKSKKASVKTRDIYKSVCMTDDRSDEEILNQSKTSGFQRTCPQTEASPAFVKAQFTCKKCDSVFQYQDLLAAHMYTHNTTNVENGVDCERGFGNNHKDKDQITSAHVVEVHKKCQTCEKIFSNKEELIEHVTVEHNPEVDWACNDCSFQGTNATTFLKHFQVTGHCPSSSVDSREEFNSFIQCYTCKLKFSGYFNLMKHRKNVHPSNKKCKNFKDGSCVYGKECWYIHEEELMDVDESFSETKKGAECFSCNCCDETFDTKNILMKHKKEYHRENVSKCELFKAGNCGRLDSSCWFIHEKETAKVLVKDTKDSHENNNTVFQEVSPKQAPPEDQLATILQTLTDLCQKVNGLDVIVKQLNQ